MLVSGALSLPPKGRRVRRLSLVPRESGALFRQKRAFWSRRVEQMQKHVFAFLVFLVKLQKTYVSCVIKNSFKKGISGFEHH